MEFTLEAIQEAQKKYTGPDFPRLIREFKKLGMVTNIYDLKTGLITYENKLGEKIEVKGNIESKVNDISSKESALVALKRNQVGESDFLTFCREIAEAGIYRWVSDLDKMTCSYYDLKEQILIVEKIPTV
ncbi:DUF1398 domain-containing protein [Clostridium folliculivorans]|uniref:Phage envelope protein n=1 Tax=Clostridium folliculivorans TaxID=2886038 RepID=A0A9W5Y0A7_9CLOT|nr:DUF1398 family protein [Clostridium folliculivorans]GKU24169.1 hypothetical protein CFOLD11_09950 [Clostridium folliculivorans]GKU30274.1 hypothetical protein CFB3_23810 [Clostridium folliculivorans]